MEFIPEPKLKRMLMNKKELDFGDGAIGELKEEFRIYTKLIDIVGINRELKRFYLIELKSKKAGYYALEQILEYLELFEESLKSSPDYREYTVQCYLIARLCCSDMMMKHLYPKIKFINYENMKTQNPDDKKKWPDVLKTLKNQGRALFRTFNPPPIGTETLRCNLCNISNASIKRVSVKMTKNSPSLSMIMCDACAGE